MERAYSELIRIPSYQGRYEYLKLGGDVGDPTFGGHRYINQQLYRSREWRQLRHRIIVRDSGCDLAMPGWEIGRYITIHHINPITLEDLELGRDCVFDPENLICVSHYTHEAIHYGDESLLIAEPIVRRPNDTCPWKEVPIGGR